MQWEKIIKENMVLVDGGEASYRVKDREKIVDIVFFDRTLCPVPYLPTRPSFSQLVWEIAGRFGFWFRAKADPSNSLETLHPATEKP